MRISQEQNKENLKGKSKGHFSLFTELSKLPKGEMGTPLLLLLNIDLHFSTHFGFSGVVVKKEED